MIKEAFLALSLSLGMVGAQAGELIDINSADVVKMAAELKGIGLTKASAIVKYREEHGPFGSVEELVEVSGISDKTLNKIREQVQVSVAEETYE
ncbi:ComEA family DNA-binding protein [Pseudomonadota bacterium]